MNELEFVSAESVSEKLSEEELLKGGLIKLDDALSFFMEMEGAAGQTIAHFLHAAFLLGEKILEAEAVDGQ